MNTPALDVLTTKTATWGQLGRGLLPLGGAVAGGLIGNQIGDGTGDETLDTVLGGGLGLVGGSLAKTVLTPQPASDAGLIAALRAAEAQRAPQGQPGAQFAPMPQ